jgi:hypothetical protein
MEKDRQESVRTKQKVPLRLVDPRRDTKVSRPSAKGYTVAVVMPLPAAPTVAARRMPSLLKASELERGRGTEIGGAGEASRELSMDDYLIEDVSMFNACTGLAASGECIHYCVSFYDGLCVFLY